MIRKEAWPFSRTEQVPQSAYVGSSKNLKDLKDQTLKQVDAAKGEAMVAPSLLRAHDGALTVYILSLSPPLSLYLYIYRHIYI